MLYRVFGGSGHGKTTYIFDRLSECVENQRKAFLVVPEQSAVAVEKEVITRLGGKSNLYIEVINFKRLCNRVFRELGGLTDTHLDEGAKKMLMMLALDEISPYLNEYGKSADNAEFAQKALAFIREMKSFKVTPAMLEEAAKKLFEENGENAASKKLNDLALIAESYEMSLSKIPGTVSDIYEKLCGKLRENSFFCGADVFFDSFYGFTKMEYEIISLVAEQADNTYITFVCDSDKDDVIFERSVTAAKQCGKIAQKTGCELCDVNLTENIRHKDSSALLAFEKNFTSNVLSDTKGDADTDNSLSTVMCGNIYDEVKWVIGKIFELVRNGSRFCDVAVCAKNTDAYIGLLDTMFQKAGIPLGIDVPETLSESALFELVVSALEAANTFSSSSVIRYVKTGLSGLDEQQADRFEIYVRTWNISSSLMKQDEDWTMNPDGYVDSKPDENVLEIVNTARKKVVTCLASLGENLKNSTTVKDYCMAIYNLLQDIKRVSSLQSFNDGNGGVSLSLLYECLDSFAGCAGDRKITLSKFVTLFKSCGKEYDTGHVPSLCDEVRFSSVDLMRNDGIKHVILLGANSGVFPSSCKASSLITELERQQLKECGVVMSESAKELVYDELFLAYCAIASAKKSCHVSFLSEDSSGDVLYPSVLITVIKRLTGNETQVFDSNLFGEYYPGDEILFEEMTVLPEGEKKATLEAYFEQKPAYKEKLDFFRKRIEQGDYLLESTTNELYGDKIVTSYSKIEKMAGCPFSHFCRYILKLKPVPAANLGPAEAGSVMHKILEELVPILCRADERGEYPDEETAKDHVKRLLHEHLSVIAHADISKLPKRFVYLYNRLSRMLNEMASNIVRELRVTKFVPSDFELNIARDSEIEPFPIDLGGGCTLYIIGQIDRVDVYRDNGKSYVRIIDYKTGKKSFNLDDIRNGFNLQMLLYLASIKQGGKEKYGENIIPAGVLYSNVTLTGKTLVLGKDDVESVSNQMTKPKASGLFIDDEEILMAMDPTENSIYLPIGRGNGKEKKKDALISLEEMGTLLDSVMATAGEFAKEMRKGLKRAVPFDGKKAGIDVDPCRYCDMHDVCMREEKLFSEDNE